MLLEQTDRGRGDILVVDDTPANLRLLVGLLTERGYKVRPVPNGKLALSAISLSPPDLILLDIMMPEMNGYEVCEQLKAGDRTRDIPVIFISAIDEVLDKVKAFSIGGVDYITKPFQIEEVLARVETHLSLHELQKSLEARNEDLARTLQELKATQEQLIESEKMAALGQLVAGIAHEINTPLGAIRSSVENIDEFLSSNLENLPNFFQSMSLKHRLYFVMLLQYSGQNHFLSSREKRKLKKALARQLTSEHIVDPDGVSDTLVDIGVNDNVTALLPLLKDTNRSAILNMACRFANLQDSTKTIITATDKAAKVVFALKSYTHQNIGNKKTMGNIIDGIETVLTLYQNQMKYGVEIVKKYTEFPPILCYYDELNQVWTNLIHNALQAMENKGTLTIEATQQEGNVAVVIADSGTGISPEIMPKIFQPFFTTKPPGEGSGLGLDIVKKIIDKHHGKIEVDSVPGQTKFTVFIPIACQEDKERA